MMFKELLLYPPSDSLRENDWIRRVVDEVHINHNTRDVGYLGPFWSIPFAICSQPRTVFNIQLLK